MLPPVRLRLGAVPLLVKAGHLVPLFMLAAVFHQLAQPSPAPLPVTLLAVAASSGSLLVHELAHGIVLTRAGGRVRHYSLGLLGASTTPDGPLPSRRAAALMLAAGPAASLLLAAVMVAGAAGLRIAGVWPVAEWVLLLGSATNLLVGLVNLIPARPLDGGRLVEVALMRLTGSDKRAAAVSAWVGAGFGVGIIAAGVSPQVTGGGVEPTVVLSGAALVMLNVGAQAVGAGTSVTVARQPRTRHGSIEAPDRARREGGDAGC